MATVQRRSMALVPAPGPAPSARGGAGALAAAVASLRTLVGDAAGPDRLLLEACRILTSTGVASAAWVLAPDGSSGELRRFASSGRVAAATAAQAWDAARATLDDGVARRLASRGGPGGTDATVAAMPLAGPHATQGVLVLAGAGSATTAPPDLQALEAVALAIGAAWSAADLVEEHERREAALREQTELLGQEVDRAVVGMALTTLDGRFVRSNPAFCRMLGYSPEELARLTIDDLTPPAERSAPTARGSGSQQADKRLVRRDGTVAWAVVSRGPILDLAGRPRYLCVQIQDLERQKSAEEEARRRADQHVAIALVGRRALSGLDLDTLFKDAAALVARALRVEIGSVLEPGADGETLRLRAAHGVADSLGGTVGPLGPQARYALSAGTPVVVEDLADDERFDPAAQLVAQGAVSGLSVAIASEGGHHAILGAHSRTRRSFGEEDVNFLEAVANVLAAAIERQRAETAIRHQATHDALTGLANRALAVEHLKMALARARRRRRSLAVVFCDLDRFKVVNDTLGHAAGDDLLRQVAGRLTEVLRAEDTIARLGGDEFVAICEDLSGPDEAQMIVERLCQAMAAAWTIGGQEVFAPASIGVVVAGGGATPTAESLLADADVAMYTAKSRGRARWAMFSPSMRSGSAGRLEHEAALRRALERNELRLFYEPVVDLAEGRIVGAEALLRWQHPALGLVAPAEFIPLAEETGLIVPIGYWTFAEASRLAAAWNRALAADGRGLTVSVNLSARQLADPDLVEAVLAATAAAGIEPGALSLEITETFLVEDPEAAAAVLAELKSHGVGLAVDDFGTGYSSLAYLKRFPVDRVKIDRSFVSALSPAPEDTAIVAAMVGLAKSLGLRSVAEGVETPEQLAQLRELGCDEGQGYFMSRPKPAEAFGTLLKSDPRW